MITKTFNITKHDANTLPSECVGINEKGGFYDKNELIKRMNSKLTVTGLIGYDIVSRDNYPVVDDGLSTKKIYLQAKFKYRKSLYYRSSLKVRFEKIYKSSLSKTFSG